MKILCFCVLVLPLLASARKLSKFDVKDEEMHVLPMFLGSRLGGPQYEREKTADYWIREAQKTVKERFRKKLNTNTAKNIILFLGDGMSIPTLAATRFYISQIENRTGEVGVLSFDKFPYSGLSKTYCVDTQVADSATTATAYLCGVKANLGTIGVMGRVESRDCAASMNTTNRVYSIARWAQQAGKRTGIVTTARVTHASPAGAYAHVAYREWESDLEVRNSSLNPSNCEDIARQLVLGETGKNFNVIMGGGRSKFLPHYAEDEEGDFGDRLDGVNLIERWLKSKSGKRAKYVWNRRGLLRETSDAEYILGLFESSHMQYHLEADEETEPTLEEMTETAIKTLRKGNEGYFLFVEGGRIDHGHHATLAQKALDETVEFSKAIQKAVDLTDQRDTLIVVTSDHAHTMSFSGYPQRDNNIFGMAGTGRDDLPYASISYANGPSYKVEDGARVNLRMEHMNGINYRFPSMVPLQSETHGGDDVGVFATGPWAHLFTGVIEQNVIPHAMAFASCIGTGMSACNED